MLTRLRHRAQGQGGFTLIELLVVILIIGILAAVAIPAFLNQRGKAQDANTKSDVNTAQTAEETYYTDAQAYTAQPTDLENIENTLTQAFTATSASPPGDGMTLSTSAAAVGATDGSATPAYSITGTSQSKVIYGLTKWSDGTVTRTCDASNASNSSGCKITNATAKTGTW